MQPPKAPESPELKYVFDMTYLVVYLHDAQMLGFKESRDLLAGLIDGFMEVRDHDLDEYVALTEQAQNEERSVEYEPPEPPDA